MSPNEFPDSIPAEVHEWWEYLRVERNPLTPELDITCYEFAGLSDEVWNELRDQIGFDFGENLPTPQVYGETGVDLGGWHVHLSIPDPLADIESSVTQMPDGISWC